jgi:hypothetical protein
MSRKACPPDFEIAEEKKGKRTIRCTKKIGMVGNVKKIIRFTTKPSIHKCIFSIADFFHQNNLDIYLKK